MTDLASLILGIPSIVEGFVNTCRAIEAYANVELKYRQVIVDAVHYSKRLKYYTHFIDSSALDEKQSDGNLEGFVMDQFLQADDGRTRMDDHIAMLRDSQDLLCGLFQNSLLALSTARKVVDEWSVRLNVGNSSRGRHRHFTTKFALTILDRLSKRTRSPGQNQESSILSNFYGKTAYLVIGSQQIEDSMARLKHWLDELHDILMVSPVLRLRLSDFREDILESGQEFQDDVLFVAMARERKRRLQTTEIIEPDLISPLRPLDDRKAQDFMLVDSQDSPYYGCLVNRRNVSHLLNKGMEEQAIKDTELIARVFAEERDELGHDISASVGVLPCCGISIPRPEHHDLVFRLPGNTRRPRTLRSLLLQASPHHPLNERLDFCIKLATAVLIVHSLTLVHKDIRPDSIIVIDHIDTLTYEAEGLQSLGEPYLVAFNESRSMDSASVPVTEAQSIERRWASLYTHPRHLLPGPRLPFEMRDDIYSLGICLLEIAMWRSLFIWDEEKKIYIDDNDLCDFSQLKYRRMLEDMGEDPNRHVEWLRHRDLISLAEKKVPINMGNAFKDVVVECLTFGVGKKSLAEIMKERNLGRSYIQNQSIVFIRNILFKLRGLKLS